MRTGWSKREGEEKWKGQGLGREEKRGQEVGGEMDRSKTGDGSPCHHCLGYIIMTMTIVRLFTYRQYVIYIRTVRTSHNVGALKVANMHCSRQLCIVVEWSGRIVLQLGLELGLGPGNGIFPSFFFCFVYKCEKRTCRGAV